MHQSGMVRLEKYQFISFENIISMVPCLRYSLSLVNAAYRELSVLYDAVAKVVKNIQTDKK